MARLDAFAAFTDDPRQADAALPVAVAPARRRAVHRLGARERACRRDIDPVGNVRARYEGRAAERAGADDRLAYRHGARRRPLRRQRSARSPRSASSRASPRSGERLDVAIEIVAFGDEEGVRFPDHPDRFARRSPGCQRAGDAGAEGRRRRHDARRARGRSAATPSASRRGARRRRRGVRRTAYRAGAGAGGRGQAARRRHARSTARRGSAPS